MNKPTLIASKCTIERRLQDVNGRPSGFDYLRLILALSVICFHTIVTSYGREAQTEVYAGPWRCVWSLILPMFFSLSGFLVAGSLERSKSLITFLGLRVIRIIPALAGEVLLSAFLLGPLVTKLPLSDYFLSKEFGHYFLNILGDIHYTLPGVFENNPLPQFVNGQLWTVPYELMCYIALTVVAILGLFKRRNLLLLTILGIYVLQFGKMLYELHVHPEAQLVQSMKGSVLVITFLCGVFVYRFRDKIPLRLDLFILSAVLGLALLYFPPHGDRFAPLPLAYFTIYIGLTQPPRQSLLLSGDYSYGLFLYSFPLQQTLVYLSLDFRHWWTNLISATLGSAVIAVGSWWLLEKPALELKGFLKKFEGIYLVKKERWVFKIRKFKGSLKSYRPHTPDRPDI